MESRIPRLLPLAALLLLLFLLAPFFRFGESAKPETKEGDIHVVFFLIDTLRADRLGTYGYPEETSPFLDKLAAEECVVFDNANAAAPWTLPSVVSLMTSRFLPQHGVVVDKESIHPELPTLASLLKDRGYSTCSVYHNPYAGPMSGLDKGFDICLQADRHVDGDHVEEWLDLGPSSPFFLYLHNASPHDPYDPEPRFLSRFGDVSDELKSEVSAIQNEYRKLTRQNNALRHGADLEDNSPRQTEFIREMDDLREDIETLYEGEVLQADDFIRQVVEALKDRGVWDNTLFVVLSDHGEELGEHGGWEHDQSLYEELVRIPLIVHFPQGEHAGRRIEDPISLVDLLPTVLDLVGETELSPSFAGRSLLPLLEGRGEAGPRVTAYRLNLKKYYTPWKESRGDENLVVRDGHWKGIWNVETDTLELYDLASDPGETTDRSEENPELAARLRDFAMEERARFHATASAGGGGQKQEISDEERDALRALGYLSEDEE